MKESIQSILEWHRETFPEATRDGQLLKWGEEKKEWQKTHRKDISELADCYIVACGLARVPDSLALIAFAWILDELSASDYSVSDLEGAIDQKMQINRARQWERKDGLYKHVKEG